MKTRILLVSYISHNASIFERQYHEQSSESPHSVALGEAGFCEPSGSGISDCCRDRQEPRPQGGNHSAWWRHGQGAIPRQCSDSLFRRKEDQEGSRLLDADERGCRRGVNRPDGDSMNPHSSQDVNSHFLRRMQSIPNNIISNCGGQRAQQVCGSSRR